MCDDEEKEEEKGNVNWLQNGKLIIEDVKKHVHHISFSNLPVSNSRILFNITILEMKEFCVQLSMEGFQIVGEKYDSDENVGNNHVHETLYSLLDCISPGYRKSFGEHLLMKLNQLKEKESFEGGDD